MSYRIRLTLLAATLLTPLWAASQAVNFVWRVSDISAEVVRDDTKLGIGQYLRLRQALRDRESGWTEMKIDLPETWQVLSATPKGEVVELAVVGGRTFRLTRENVGELSFRILDGAKRRPDAQLEQLWNEIARASSR
jgi:hypothetical protein